MIEVTQTKFGHKYGNCYAACIASIFELDLSKFPAVPEDERVVLEKYPITDPEYYTIKDSINSWWWDMWRDWFSENNLVSIRIESNLLTRYDRKLLNTWHIINGPSPRDKEQNMLGRQGGMLHAVVGRKGIVQFDPHPDRTGLLAIDDYELIVPSDPAKPILESYKNLTEKL